MTASNELRNLALDLDAFSYVVLRIREYCSKGPEREEKAEVQCSKNRIIIIIYLFLGLCTDRPVFLNYVLLSCHVPSCWTDIFEYGKCIYSSVQKHSMSCSRQRSTFNLLMIKMSRDDICNDLFFSLFILRPWIKTVYWNTPLVPPPETSTPPPSTPNLQSHQHFHIQRQYDALRRRKQELTAQQLTNWPTDGQLGSRSRLKRLLRACACVCVRASQTSFISEPLQLWIHAVHSCRRDAVDVDVLCQWTLHVWIMNVFPGMTL